MRAVALPAGDNSLPRLPAELALGDALTEVQGPVHAADAPDLRGEVLLGGRCGAPVLPGAVGPRVASTPVKDTSPSVGWGVPGKGLGAVAEYRTRMWEAEPRGAGAGAAPSPGGAGSPAWLHDLRPTEGFGAPGSTEVPMPVGAVWGRTPTHVPVLRVTSCGKEAAPQVNPGDAPGLSEEAK